ncbi:MAG TPA: homocysteine S-methyltransferase family protein [Candidatus Dormibacteraeota bacterium]
MSRYRDNLPQLAGGIYLSDSGMETDLIFNEGYDLPLFSSFVLLNDEAGTEALRRYYRRHAEIARASGVGFILEAATWRASSDWGARLGFTREALDEVNRRAVELLVTLRGEFDATIPVVVSAAVGPRDDAYRPSALMTAAEAQRYHSTQIRSLSSSDADLITAFTLTHTGEAIGIARAAKAVTMPVVLSFTVETDGALPDGTSLRDAIATVDEQTDHAPAYYGINCAHPSHFAPVLEPGAAWMERVRMIRANASRRSHAELDESDTLDAGNPGEFGVEYAQLRATCPGLTVLGGCCGTDHRHVQEIARTCLTR